MNRHRVDTNSTKKSHMRKGNALVYVLLAIVAMAVLAAVMVPSFKNADMGPRISNMKEYLNYLNKSAIPQYMGQTPNKDFAGMNMCTMVENGILKGAYAAKTYGIDGNPYVIGTTAQQGVGCYLLTDGTPAAGTKMFANVGDLTGTGTTNYTLAIADAKAGDTVVEWKTIESDLQGYLQTISGLTVDATKTVVAGVIAAGGTASDGQIAAQF